MLYNRARLTPRHFFVLNLAIEVPLRRLKLQMPFHDQILIGIAGHRSFRLVVAFNVLNKDFTLRSIKFISLACRFFAVCRLIIQHAFSSIKDFMNKLVKG
jgi:hypothetical protein